MEYKKFKEELRKKVQEEAGAGTEVCFQEIERNNQVKQEGMSVKLNGSRVSAILPLGELYGRYQESCSMGQTVSDALKMLEEKPEVPEGKLPKTWAEARGKLHAELVHYDWNRERLGSIPHQRFLNFAVAYRMEVPISEGCQAGLQVAHRLMEVWGVTEGELHKAAMENLENEDYQIQPMSKLLGELLGTVLELPEDAPEEYVLSNTRCCYGAAGMLREDILAGFSAKIGGSFYILPSSVHELILVPESPSICMECIKEIVKEVNEGAVAREEWLSEDVYYYDCKEKKVRIAG